MKNTFLNFRKKIIDRVRGAVNVSAVATVAYNFKNHMFDLFKKTGKLLDSAVNWVKLDFGQRKSIIKQIVPHALKFVGVNYDVKVNYCKNYAENKNTLGSTNGQEINIYDKLVECDDFDKVIDTVTHEPVHIGQIRNTNATTLSRNVIENCYYNYVSPYEDFEYYKINPIEVEAHAVGQGVSHGFTKKLQEFYISRERAA